MPPKLFIIIHIHHKFIILNAFNRIKYAKEICGIKQVSHNMQSLLHYFGETTIHK